MHEAGHYYPERSWLRKLNIYKKALKKRHRVTYIIDTVSFKFVLMGGKAKWNLLTTHFLGAGVKFLKVECISSKDCGKDFEVKNAEKKLSDRMFDKLLFSQLK